MGLSSGLRRPTGVTIRARPSTSYARVPRRAAVTVRASDDDAELEARLERLRKAKGATPYGQGAKAAAVKKSDGDFKPMPKKKATYDYAGEVEKQNGPPHRGDLAVNVALGTTLIWLPLTFAAVGRGLYMNYRFTDKRISITSNAPWKVEKTDVPYQEVKEVITVGRGIGLWGDMVITLRDDSKVELRSVENFLEMKAYVMERAAAMAPAGGDDTTAPKQMKGGVVTAEELMGETVPAGGKGKGKGFA